MLLCSASRCYVVCFAVVFRVRFCLVSYLCCSHGVVSSVLHLLIMLFVGCKTLFVGLFAYLFVRCARVVCCVVSVCLLICLFVFVFASVFVWWCVSVFGFFD